MAQGGTVMSYGHLQVSPIGNCSVSALVDSEARFVWGCLPRVDGDPAFSALLSGQDPADEKAIGMWSITLEDQVAVSQAYERNTPILRTVLTDARGASLEIIDFCPRFRRFNRIYRPLAYARVVRPLKGVPRIRVRLAPTANWGAQLADRTFGSNHIRYLATGAILRLTTTIPVSLVASAQVFRLETEHVFFLGPDEPFDSDVRATILGFYGNTRSYWQEWVRGLATPLEWQSH